MDITDPALEVLSCMKPFTDRQIETLRKIFEPDRIPDRFRPEKFQRINPDAVVDVRHHKWKKGKTLEQLASRDMQQFNYRFDSHLDESKEGNTTIHQQYWLRKQSLSRRDKDTIEPKRTELEDIRLAYVTLQKDGLIPGGCFEVDKDRASSSGITFDYGHNDRPNIELYVDLNDGTPFRTSVILYLEYASYEKDPKTKHVKLDDSRAHVWKPLSNIPLTDQMTNIRRPFTPPTFATKVLRHEWLAADHRQHLAKTLYTMRCWITGCIFQNAGLRLDSIIQQVRMDMNLDTLRTLPNLVFLQNLYYNSSYNDIPFTVNLFWPFPSLPCDDPEQISAHEESLKVMLHYANHPTYGTMIECTHHDCGREESVGFEDRKET